MKLLILATFVMSTVAVSAQAFQATITKVDSLKPHPVATVSKGELQPIDGVVIAEPRAPAVYQPETGGRASSLVLGKIPVPMPRPVVSLACPIVWAD